MVVWLCTDDTLFFSRLDIVFAVSKLSKYNANPTTTHFKAGLHVLRYLKVTRHYCIVYKRSTNVPILDIIGYADSDFVSDEDNRKSYTGYVFLINGGAVSWFIHKQSTVASISFIVSTALQPCRHYKRIY